MLKLSYILWLLGPCLQVGVAGLMVRRKLVPQFPYFFSYTLFQVISVAILFTLFRSSHDVAYFYAFWFYSTLSILIGLAVLHEVFSFALRPYTGLRDLGMMLFRWVALLLVLISAVMAASGASNQMDSISRALVNLELSIRVMQCGLLLFMFICASSLGLSWRTPAFGVALGFGIFAATDLCVSSLKAHLGPAADGLLNTVRSAAYNFSVLCWLAYVARPEPVRAIAKVVYQPVFDRWNQAAMLVLNQGPTGGVVAEQASYLSDLERTVADIMATNVRHIS